MAGHDKAHAQRREQDQREVFAGMRRDEVALGQGQHRQAKREECGLERECAGGEIQLPMRCLCVHDRHFAGSLQHGHHQPDEQTKRGDAEGGLVALGQGRTAKL